MKWRGLARDIAQLDAALQKADSVTAIASALHSARLVGETTVISLGVFDSAAQNVHFEYAGPVPSELRDRFHVATLDTPLVPIDVIKSGKPMVVTDTADLDQRYDYVVQETAKRVGACVSQPLRGEDGQIIGSLGLLWPAPRKFDRAELELFARIAETTQSAVERVRGLECEHRNVELRLLDLDHGSTTAVVAAMHQRPDAATRAGREWHLVLPLQQPDAVAVCVGTVLSDDLADSTATTRLRDTVAASALVDAEPAAVLTALGQSAATAADASAVTVAYAVVDSISETAAADGDGAVRIRYSCAGNPGPLLISPDRTPILLDAGRHPPLSDVERREHATGTVSAPPGSMMMLYTGLVERPGESLDRGLDRLKRSAAHCEALSAADSCAELLRRMRPPGGYRGDAVVLALRPSHAAARSFATALPATLTQLPQVRHRLRDWLATLGIDASRQLDILLATGEAVTNAIEHGSRCDPDRTVAVEAFLRGDTVPVTVSDSGQWSGDSAASRRGMQRGRGLSLINGLADRVETIRTAAGSRIILQFDCAVAS